MVDSLLLLFFEIIDDLESSQFSLRSIICHITDVWLSLEYMKKIDYYMGTLGLFPNQVILFC